MLLDKQMKQYAGLIIQQGINPFPGQTLVIKIPAEQYAFARLLQAEAYRAGCGRVEIDYTDMEAERINLLYAEEQKLSLVRESELLCAKERQKEKAAFLHIVSAHPGAMKGVDEAKAGRIRQFRQRILKDVREYTLKSMGQWCVAALPNNEWAKQVFPDIKDEEKALEALYQAVFHAVYLDTGKSPNAAWRKHTDTISRHCDIMNRYSFSALEFHNSSGTDLFVPLPKGHLWAGGSECAMLNGQPFDPNIPTEEIFTVPHRMKTEGTVTASRPLCVDGQMIDGFSFTFHKGKVVEWKASKGKKTLAQLLASDSGSMRLGEVALVPYDSSIRELNLLFYDTLFDENAACHLALGASYPTSLEAGEFMDEAELRKCGANVSSIHVDFMFGTEDLSVTGITADGTTVEVFRNGNFVF